MKLSQILAQHDSLIIKQCHYNIQQNMFSFWNVQPCTFVVIGDCNYEHSLSRCLLSVATIKPFWSYKLSLTTVENYTVIEYNVLSHPLVRYKPKYRNTYMQSGLGPCYLSPTLSEIEYFQQRSPVTIFNCYSISEEI